MSLINFFNFILAEYGLPRKIMSDKSTNFVSEKFKDFSMKLNVEQAISSSYHHQNNGQVDACINVYCAQWKADLILLLRWTYLFADKKHTMELVLSSLAKLLFNRPLRPDAKINRGPINYDQNKATSKTLRMNQKKYIMNNGDLKEPFLIHTVVNSSHTMSWWCTMDPWYSIGA